VFNVAPERRASSSVVNVPIAAFKLARQVAVSELSVPSAKGELVEVSDQDVVQFFVSQVRLNAMPVSLQVVVLHTPGLGMFARCRSDDCLGMSAVLSGVGRKCRRLIVDLIHVLSVEDG
jgi:hypothetical protein